MQRNAMDEAINNSQNTFIFQLISQNNLQTLKQLSLDHFDLTIKIGGKTPLEVAHTWEMKTFLIKNKKTDQKDGAGFAKQLHAAARYNQTNIVKLFLEAGSPTNLLTTVKHDDGGRNEFFFRKYSGHISDYHTEPKKFLSALHCAVLNDNNEMIQLLIQYGADITLKDEFGESPLELAASLQRHDCYSMILQSKANLLYADWLKIKNDDLKQEIYRFHCAALKEIILKVTQYNPSSPMLIYHQHRVKKMIEIAGKILKNEIASVSGYEILQLSVISSNMDAANLLEIINQHNQLTNHGYEMKDKNDIMLEIKALLLSSKDALKSETFTDDYFAKIFKSLPKDIQIIQNELANFSDKVTDQNEIFEVYDNINYLLSERTSHSEKNARVDEFYNNLQKKFSPITSRLQNLYSPRVEIAKVIDDNAIPSSDHTSSSDAASSSGATVSNIGKFGKQQQVPAQVVQQQTRQDSYSPSNAN